MQASGVETAILELQKKDKKIQEVIATLRRIQRSGSVVGNNHSRRRLSAQARRRISEAAKKRWAAARSVKGTGAKKA